MAARKKTPTQHGRELVEYFLSKYYSTYGENPSRVNRNTLTFGFKDLYLDYGDDAVGLIDYYFDSYKMHDPKVFLNKYGDIAEEKIEDEKDAAWRKKVYAATAKSLKENKSE